MITSIIVFVLGYLVIRHFTKRLSSKRRQNKSKPKSYTSSAFQYLANRRRNNQGQQSTVSHNDDDYTSDGRLIMYSDDPDTLPPLPRYPLPGRAARPAPKSTRRISPWGGTTGTTGSNS